MDSLAVLLDDIAARTPAPGGGTTAALACALAAALAEMAARFAEDGSVARAGELRAAALDLAERELTTYAPVLEAARLPRDDPQRAARLAAALAAAADPPLALCRVAAATAELAAEAVRGGTPALEGDATTAVLLAEAACRSAARLAELNLAATPADPRLTELAALTARAAAARAAVLP